MRNWRCKELLILLALVSLSGRPALATSVSTPFELNLDANTANQLLLASPLFPPLSGSVNLTLPDEELANPFPTSVSGITLAINYAFNAPIPSNTLGQWTFQSQSLSADLTVSQINASGTVEVQEGGTTLIVDVTGQCSNVHLTLPAGSTAASGTITATLVDGHISLQLSNFTANWTPGSWQVTSLTCTGPQGFGQLVQQAAMTDLSSINPFLSPIQDAIQAQLSSQSGAISPLMLNLPVAPGSSPVTLTLTPKSITTSDDNEESLRGTALFSFPGVTNSAHCGKVIKEPLTHHSRESVLFPFVAIKEVLRCAYANRMLHTSIPSTGITAFQNLLQTPLESIAVWPDLLRFDPSSVFQFGLALTSTPKIGKPGSGGKGVIDVDLDFPLLVPIQAPEKNGKLEPYLDFKTRITGPSRWNFSADTVTITEPNPHLLVGLHWDRRYLEKYHPDPLINLPVIQNAAQDYLSNTGILYRFPSWNLTGSTRLSVNGADLLGDDLSIGLTLQ